jgi:replication initiation and membrane attachment protein DnaB
MRPGAAGVVMLANWNRHPSLCTVKNPEQFAEKNNWMDWFFNNEQLSRKLIESAGFVNFVDLKPDFRDTLAYFESPLAP